jgi:hypothetical protein
MNFQIKKRLCKASLVYFIIFSFKKTCQKICAVNKRIADRKLENTTSRSVLFHSFKSLEYSGHFGAALSF